MNSQTFCELLVTEDYALFKKEKNKQTKKNNNLLVLCWAKVEKKWPLLENLPSLHRSVQVVLSFISFT